jgi:hypothetical protein
MGRSAKGLLTFFLWKLFFVPQILRARESKV